LIVPGLMGCCIYSPPLSEYSNSVRGTKFCELVSSRFNLH
jgi:glutaminase